MKVWEIEKHTRKERELEQEIYARTEKNGN